MAMAATRVGTVADSVEVRGSRRALLFGLGAWTLVLLALPALIGVLVLVGVVS
jgi:hypothetical protein